MNFFPSLNRSKKVHSFANPLNGLIYRHQTIAPLASPKAQLATISFLSQQPKSTSRPPPLKTNSHIRFQKGELPESSNRTSQSVHRSSHIMKQYDTLQSEVVKHQDRGRTEMKSPRVVGYCFPQVEVLPLPLIRKFEDIVTTKLRISLQKYFKLYFHAGLRSNSKTLNEKIQKYLPLLQRSGLLDQSIDKKMWPKQFWEIKNTQQLLFWIEKYQKNASDYWVRYILVLMQLYCVPHPDIRRSTLENVLLTLSKQISIMTDKPISQNYVLLLDNGTPVADVLDIPFSTCKLYLAEKTHAERQVDAYRNFLNMVKEYHEECRKKGFIGRLRKHFRREIVPDKYDEESINYEADFVEKDKVRKVTFQRAMDLLDKKGSSRKNLSKHVSPLPSARPKSRESIWKQQNVEENQTARSKIPPFYFHIDLSSKTVQKEIQAGFEHYHSLSKQADSSIGPQEIFIYIIEEHHPIVKELIKNRFHSLRVKTILELVTEDKLSDDRRASRQKMTWREYVEFAVLCHPQLEKLVHLPDCHQIVRNFVEKYLNMKEEDYFREELTAKLFSTYEGDSQSLAVMEEVLWSWLAQNDFLRHGAIQRELLWRWESRSRLFYLLMVAMILGTFKTTPMDLAYSMLV